MPTMPLETESVGASGIASPRRKADLGAFAADLEDQIARSIESAADLTAVERFSRWHEHGTVPAHEPFYRDLMPASAPAPGFQYAFEVDLDKCSSCKACVAACHSQNGLDPAESWRTVGTLVGKESRATVTSSCHHCVEPGCASGCPTLAYEKDDLTGIVKHLDDQCMGCQYCTWTCPYDAPKWNESLGIVRKCDMCHGRLAAGEAPACVQSCPSRAIRIVVVDKDALKADPNAGTRLPGIVPPERTLPTTAYLNLEDPASSPADRDVLRPEHAHAPLAVLLVLTQWAAGIWILEILRRAVGWQPWEWARPCAGALLLAGLGIGTLHLGRPLKAWKAFLGWRRSWFSREVLAMGTAVPFVAVASVPVAIAPIPESVATIANGLAAAFLLAGVGCSAMLYMATPRPAWARAATAWRFGLTTLGGGAVVLGASGMQGLRWMGVASIVAGVAKAILVLSDRRPRSEPTGALVLQARLLRGPLASQARAQAVLFVFAVAAAALGSWTGVAAWLVVALVFRMASDLVERTLFFRSCPPTRMPGGV